jgi:DNA mismatch repair ATPase MutS
MADRVSEYIRLRNLMWSHPEGSPEFEKYRRELLKLRLQLTPEEYRRVSEFIQNNPDAERRYQELMEKSAQNQELQELARNLAFAVFRKPREAEKEQ